MNAAGPPFQSQAKLWLTAFVVSALLNAVVILAIGFWVLANLVITPPRLEEVPFESVALIVPQVAAETPVAAATPEPVLPPPPANPAFVRTSPDQAEEKPESPDFIGERNTRATSDAAPLADAPDLPSQKGREPRWEDEIETTESEYQDGDLAHDRSATPDSPAMPEPVVRPEGPDSPVPPTSEVGAPPVPEPPMERLVEGPVPVDRRVKESPESEEPPKPAPTERSEEGKEESKEQGKPAEAPTPAGSSPQSPGFRGNQKKTRLEGSISRVGRSALDVEDSLLGRYHAAVSRAVEKEWQRNCVRNRDYITPGQLTMRVMLEASGKVRSVGFVEELGVGNIPKGFTLNSIRDAEIPAMPGELKKQLDGEPLELIYRFNF